VLEWYGERVEDLLDYDDNNNSDYDDDDDDAFISNNNNDNKTMNNDNSNSNNNNNDSATSKNNNNNNNNNNNMKKLALDYTPIVLLSVSPPITDSYHNEIHSWTYIQGAGGDENWCMD
jgi:hypothetical protein